MASGWKTWGHSALCYITVLFMHITLITADVIIRDGNLTERLLSMPSRFGNQIPDMGLTGILFIAEPIDACQRIAPPPVNRSVIFDYLFVLILRGECQFDYKVLKAQESGYDGAIVYNDQSNTILSMTGEKYAAGVFIPSVFVGHDDGLFLYDFVHDTAQNVTITRGTSLPWGYYLYPFITVFATCFIFSCFYGVTKFVRDRRRLRRIRLSRDHLKKLPVIKFKKGDERYDCCAICLDDYEEGNKLRVLPCQHAFHCKCIDPWLTNNRRTCPICKRKVVPAGVPDSDEESEDSSVDENTPLLGGGGSGNRSSSRASPTPDEMLWGAIGGQREPSPEVVLGPPTNPTAVCESYDSGIVNNSATEQEEDGALELAPSRDQGEENGSLDVLVNLNGSDNNPAPIV